MLVTLFDDALLPDLEDIFDRDALEAGDHEMVVTVHLDTDENQVFDYVRTDGAVDGPYLDAAGEAVTDEAVVTVEPLETPTPEPDTPTPEPDTPTPEPDTPTPDPDTPTPEPDTPTPEPNGAD